MPVIGLAAGVLNGQATISYTVDGDSDLANTLEDIELYAGAAGSAAKKITSNSVPEQNPQFAKVAVKTNWSGLQTAVSSPPLPSQTARL